MPKRIQRKRTKGWRMPTGAVYVGRPTKWGNPFKIGAPHPVFGAPMDAEDARDLYELSLPDDLLDQLDELKGKDLCCWCRLDQPCHADVLLRLANENKCAKIPNDQTRRTRSWS